MKITVVGAGYVGLSLSVLLSQNHKVLVLDIDKKKVDLINKKKSPIKDVEIEDYLLEKNLDLTATSKNKYAYNHSDYVIVATPTNYDIATKSFDTSTVEAVISDALKQNREVTIAIKSTVPLGFTDKVKNRFNTKKIFFSPEFLREGKALYDNLYPSRIVVGDTTDEAKKFGEMLLKSSNKKISSVKIHYMKSKEAEAVKLFSNTYLAMRIAYFNELDTFAEVHDVSSKKIINAVSDDPRIGNYYNNPSFGYGGYCLPKDTKQLLENYQKIPNELIKAVIDSNQTRKNFVANSVINKSPKSVGVYRLAMKSGSDNIRESAVIDLIDLLQKENIEVILYEPLIDSFNYKGTKLINNLSKFISISDMIIANRFSEELKDVQNKVYTRDLFYEN